MIFDVLDLFICFLEGTPPMPVITKSIDRDGRYLIRKIDTDGKEYIYKCRDRCILFYTEHCPCLSADMRYEKHL